LVVETDNGNMVNSSYTARKLIDELYAKDTLKVLWDPTNNCWSHEVAYPDGYYSVRDGYLGHIHIQDLMVDIPRATLTVKRWERVNWHRFLRPLPMRCGGIVMTE
jgi:sugar phosphate isomerase/epimerase